MPNWIYWNKMPQSYHMECLNKLWRSLTVLTLYYYLLGSHCKSLKLLFTLINKLHYVPPIPLWNNLNHLYIHWPSQHRQSNCRIQGNSDAGMQQKNHLISEISLAHPKINKQGLNIKYWSQQGIRCLRCLILVYGRPNWSGFQMLKGASWTSKEESVVAGLTVTCQ